MAIIAITVGSAFTKLFNESLGRHEEPTRLDIFSYVIDTILILMLIPWIGNLIKAINFLFLM